MESLGKGTRTMAVTNTGMGSHTHTHSVDGLSRNGQFRTKRRVEWRVGMVEWCVLSHFDSGAILPRLCFVQRFGADVEEVTCPLLFDTDIFVHR